MKLLFIFFILPSSLAFTQETMLLSKGALLLEMKPHQVPSDQWEISSEVNLKTDPIRWESNGKKVGFKVGFYEPLGDHIMEYTFKYSGNLERNQITYNDHNGHCLVVLLGEDQHIASKWPDQDIVNSFREHPDVSSSTLQAGQDIKVRVEIQNSHLLIYVNDKNFLYGQNYRLSNPKTQVRVKFEGDHGTLNSIKVWEGLPNPKRTENITSLERLKASRVNSPLAVNTKLQKEVLISQTRRQLLNSKNQELQKYQDDITNFMKKIQAQYPFYGQRKSDQVKRQLKEAKADSTFQIMMKELSQLKLKEEDYLLSQ